MQQLINQITAFVEQHLLGKHHQIQLAIACLLARGHLLIEDLPGMGKTTLAHALANAFNLSFQRLQFTSDMLPADVVGFTMYDQQKQQFELHKGPIFSQILLADEINRASPKTQSALLEAMEERQVTIDGESHTLAEPFFVIATQNPFFHAGTYVLPESQLDRFMMRLSLGFPDKSAEKQILRQQVASKVSPSACQLTDLIKLQQQVDTITVSDALLDYVIALLTASRQANFEGNPLSPRAGKALVQVAKAWALIAERDYVIPEDIQAVFTSVCEHRLSALLGDNHSESGLAKQILASVDVVQ